VKVSPDAKNVKLRVVNLTMWLEPTGRFVPEHRCVKIYLIKKENYQSRGLIFNPHSLLYGVNE